MAIKGFDADIIKTQTSAPPPASALHTEWQQSWNSSGNKSNIQPVNDGPTFVPLLRLENLGHAKEVLGSPTMQWESVGGGAFHLGSEPGKEIPTIVLVPMPGA